jgi:hypothetical protein
LAGHAGADRVGLLAGYLGEPLDARVGQAGPGCKVPCSDFDYTCQDSWFTGYMLSRYGSWQAVKSHWLAGCRSNGREVGN